MSYEENDVQEYDSWSRIKNKKRLIARKKVDKSFIKQGGSGIPSGLYSEFPTVQKITEERLEVDIKLIYQGNIYKGNILRKKTGRVWINIKDEVLKKKLPELFKQSVEYIEQQEPYIETTKKFVIVPDYRAEYVEFYKTDEEDVYEMQFILQGDKEMMNKELLDLQIIYQKLKSKGFEYNYHMLSNFYLSLKSKPFVILSGISGTGKSKLVRLFSEAIGANFTLIPVRPDWSDATELLGYRDINQEFHAGKLTEIIDKASNDRNTPYVVCLDEMNLARVEYYFSDLLSLIESRHWEGGRIVTDNLPIPLNKSGEFLSIPDNLYIVGTVNMDETTFQFSKKVLDRANTIELNDVNLAYSFEEETNEIQSLTVSNETLRSEYLILRDCKEQAALASRVIDELIVINEILIPCQMQFAYRVRDEVIFYMVYNEVSDLMSEEEAFDYQLLQKVLPRINGTSVRTQEALVKLFWYCVDGKNHDQSSYDLTAWQKETADARYPKSALKLLDMLRRYEEDGFTSFWF